MSDPNCIFCKIARGQIPAKKIHDDDEVMAFHDIRPQAPVHFLIVPKAHIVNLYDAQGAHQAALGKMLTIAGLTHLFNQLDSPPDRWPATLLNQVLTHRRAPAQDDTMMVSLYRAQ